MFLYFLRTFIEFQGIKGDPTIYEKIIKYIFLNNVKFR
jgi:hypothetical protein